MSYTRLAGWAFEAAERTGWRWLRQVERFLWERANRVALVEGTQGGSDG